MESKTIQKYKNKSIPQLIKIATVHFNKFIRERDKYNGCISCGKKVEEAGHFYSGGHYSVLRFNEKNVYGQCKRCNRFLHGNLNEYRKNLPDDVLSELDFIADHYKRIPFKWDRIRLIEIIEKYKALNKLMNGLNWENIKIDML